MVKDTLPAIDIRNVYYMFLYAWGAFEGGATTILQATENTDLVNLFAKLLLKETSYLVRRRLDQGYCSSIEETSSPRGRFLLSESMKRGSLHRSRLFCLFDELTPDLLHNQIIKSTIECLLASGRLERGLANEFEALRRHFGDIASIRLSSEAFYRTRLTRNTKHYKLALKVCELLHTHLLVGEGDTQTKFANLLNDEVKMHKIFEEFVRKFYAAEQTVFEVSSPRVSWAVSEIDHPDTAFLPTMCTDIVLRSPARTLIIDTKFYGQILKGQYGRKVQSGHLYQILTYVSQWNLQHLEHIRPNGILLYAEPRFEQVDLRYEIGGFPIRVVSIDLSRPWWEIHTRLLLIAVGSNEAQRIPVA